MDSDIVRLLNEDVITNMSIEVSYRYLPYITLPSRIAQLSTTWALIQYKDVVLPV